MPSSLQKNVIADRRPSFPWLRGAFCGMFMSAALAGTSFAAPVAQDDVVSLQVAQQVASFYSARKHKPLWLAEDGSLTPAGTELLAALRSISVQGLVAPIPEQADRHFDQKLTEAAIQLAKMLRNGVLEPPASDGERHNSVDVASLLGKLSHSTSPAQWLQQSAPQLWLYGDLQKALVKARAQADAGGWPTVPSLPQRKIQPGEEFSDAHAWRLRLAATGELPVEFRDDETQVYDPPLVEAVKTFQRTHGLEDDGVIGRQTWVSANISAQQRLQQVKINLDRLRWLPDSLGERFVLVNIPSFQAWMVERDAIVFETPVIVGKGQQPTPAFSDAIRSVVLNPSWEVPRSIALKEILPKLALDPGYLAHENMDALSGWEGGGTVVDPATVNWKALAAAEKLPYRFRQRPGPKNALGYVKLLFPNSYDVYLHDTPTRGLFNRRVRAFSHGCMRVGKAQELAALALGWPLEKVQEAIASGKETHLKVSTPLPIHIIYLTAGFDAATGAVTYQDDLYQRDAVFLNKLPKVMGEPTL